MYLIYGHGANTSIVYFLTGSHMIFETVFKNRLSKIYEVQSSKIWRDLVCLSLQIF